MKSIGAPEALMPGSHYADGRYKNTGHQADTTVAATARTGNGTQR